MTVSVECGSGRREGPSELRPEQRDPVVRGIGLCRDPASSGAGTCWAAMFDTGP